MNDPIVYCVNCDDLHYMSDSCVIDDDGTWN